MREEVKKFISKAEHALNVAEDLLKSGYPSDLIRRIKSDRFSE